MPKMSMLSRGNVLSIMDEAKQNAEENIRDMFYAALGDAYAIEFQWRE